MKCERDSIHCGVFYRGISANATQFTHESTCDHPPPLPEPPSAYFVPHHNIHNILRYLFIQSVIDPAKDDLPTYVRT